MGHLFANRDRAIETLAEGCDVQTIGVDQLITSVFAQIKEPVKLSDLVDLVAELRGVSNHSVTSFDNDDGGIGQILSDSTLRIDTLLEMRDCLKLPGKYCAICRERT